MILLQLNNWWTMDWTRGGGAINFKFLALERWPIQSATCLVIKHNNIIEYTCQTIAHPDRGAIFLSQSNNRRLRLKCDERTLFNRCPINGSVNIQRPTISIKQSTQLNKGRRAISSCTDSVDQRKFVRMVFLIDRPRLRQRDGRWSVTLAEAQPPSAVRVDCLLKCFNVKGQTIGVLA